MFRFLGLACLLGVLGCAPYHRYDTKDIRARWSEDIAAFDRQSRLDLPADPVLFYGSSSIRMWKTMDLDLAPIPTVNRGYGGASLHDAAYFARRVLRPIEYRALALFVANDIYGNEYDKTPEEIVDLIRYVVHVSHRHRPDAPVFLIEITQTPARRHLVAEWDAANAALKAYADTRDYVHFIPTRDLFMTAGEETRPELFLADGLHQNADGYALWSRRIKDYLLRYLPPASTQSAR